MSCRENQRRDQFSEIGPTRGRQKEQSNQLCYQSQLLQADKLWPKTSITITVGHTLCTIRYYQKSDSGSMSATYSFRALRSWVRDSNASQTHLELLRKQESFYQLVLINYLMRTLQSKYLREIVWKMCQTITESASVDGKDMQERHYTLENVYMA